MSNTEIERVLESREQSALLKLIDDRTIEEGEKADVVARILKILEEQFFEGLPELVVKVCVEEPQKIAVAARRRFLSYWLRGQGYYYRRVVIESLVTRLKTETDQRLEAAIRTAWVVGYRDDRLVSELESIAGLHNQTPRDANAEGWALAVLSSMSYLKRRVVSSRLLSRLRNNKELTESDCWTAKYAATPDMIPALVDAAKSQLLAVSALLDLPKRHVESAKGVFNAFISLNERDQLLYGNNLISSIDLPEVGVYVLDRTLNAFEETGKRNVLPPVNQLLNANAPNQLSSFVQAKEGLTADKRKWLEAPAIKTTGNEMDFHTSESLTKEAVWDVILRLGLAEAREWLPQAMENERNFTLLKLAEFASFLRIQKATLPLIRIVLDEEADYRIGLGCLAPLGVIGSVDAMKALIESRVHKQESGNDDIPLALIEAIASACMTQKSSDLVWNRLRDAKSSSHVRKVCAYALEDLSGYMDAPLPNITDLTNLLLTEGSTLPGYDSLLLVLSTYQDSIALDFLQQIGASTHQSNELTQALAVSGLLIDFPSRVEALGFEKVGDDWIITKPVTPTAALALLCLYRADPSFERAVIKVLEDDSLHLATQIIANLRRSDRLSQAIRESLLQRAVHWNSRYFADRLSLEALALTWPEPLLGESFVKTVSLWESSARRAYISSLRVALTEANNRDTIANLACRFLVDDDSEVRRDAARLALESNPNILRQAVHGLSENRDNLDQAIFLLDAAFWLDSDWPQFASVGASHREPLVREHHKTLQREREQLLLARTYLSIILKSEDYLETWCYGQALVGLGNEETVDQIYAGLPSEVYRRSYLIWLAKNLKKRLEKTRSDQNSKQYLPPPAASEKRLEMSFEVDEKILGPFSGVLTESYSRRAHRWLWSWSVYIEKQPELVETLTFRSSGKPVYVRVDGRRGQVLVASSKLTTESEHSRLILQGTGPLEKE
jgi:hypothetical protein